MTSEDAARIGRGYLPGKDLRWEAAMRGVVWVLAAALSVTIANAADDDIIFASKNFYDNDFAVAISGTLTGDGVLYKNNTHSIWCIKDRHECLIASIPRRTDGLACTGGGPNGQAIAICL
jgi:hypothetical protein